MAKEFAKEFYHSAAWQRTRKAYYKCRYGLCERCGAAGDIVHHKKYLTPQNIHDPSIALDFSNLELLCQDCHNKEHLSKQKKRYLFDKNGNVIPPIAKNTRYFGDR